MNLPRSRFTPLMFITALCLFPAVTQAAESGPPDWLPALDTVWLAVAAALVFFMQAGFALLESGMSRAKNAVNVVMKNYVDVCLGSLAFWLVGYGLMFGFNPTGWFGQSHFALIGAENGDYMALLFQTMFAATAVTIASGAMAERTRYQAYLLGAVLITAIIYPVYGSWAWGGAHGGEGWLAASGSSTSPAPRWCIPSAAGWPWRAYWCWGRAWGASAPTASAGPSMATTSPRWPWAASSSGWAGSASTAAAPAAPMSPSA